MSYTVVYHKGVGGGFPLSSKIATDKCNACGERTKVQVLPAEHNAGEIYTAELCGPCLILLAEELLK